MRHASPLPRTTTAADARPLRPAMLRRPEDGLILYRIALDEAAGLVRAEARGIWSRSETERYVADLGAFVVASRRRLGKVRVLLDRRAIPAQSPEVVQQLDDANRALFQGDDKIALVVDSSLMKASLRQRMLHAGTKAFLSTSAAETWLTI